MVWRHEREARSHSLSVLSNPPESARALSCNATTDQTPAVWPSSFTSSRPELASQMSTDLSKQPETTRFPSGVIATDVTLSPCPSSVTRHAPLSRSQIFTVLSCEPDAAHFPSADGHAPDPARVPRELAFPHGQRLGLLRRLHRLGLFLLRLGLRGRRLFGTLLSKEPFDPRRASRLRRLGPDRHSTCTRAAPSPLSMAR